MSLLLKVFVGVVAVLLGVLLGMPGKAGGNTRLPGRNRIGEHDEKRIRELEGALGRAARRSGAGEASLHASGPPEARKACL